MERLQKVLARAGIASRRAAEQIILAGRVRVDGRVVRELGQKVDAKSRVEVDGTKIVAEKLVYLVLHKPRAVVCTLSDPEGRPTVRELLKDAGARVVPVGRLDFHTSGALLCTNDGEFAQALAHPKREVPKVYVAKVKGVVDDEALERFRSRVVIDGRPTEPAQVKLLRHEGDKTWLEITLREGRNRQVRRLGEATGFPVMRLSRISHAGVTSEDLRPGQWRPLSVDELVDLKKAYGVPKKVRAPEAGAVVQGKPRRAPGAAPRPLAPRGPHGARHRDETNAPRGPQGARSHGPRDRNETKASRSAPGARHRDEMKASRSAPGARHRDEMKASRSAPGARYRDEMKASRSAPGARHRDETKASRGAAGARHRDESGAPRDVRQGRAAKSGSRASTRKPPRH